MSVMSIPSPMEELAHLLRLQKYHKRKRRDLQDRVNRLKVASETQKRLMRGQPKFQKSLADCIRTGEKAEFRQAFDTFKDVRNLTVDLIGSQRLSSGGLDDRPEAMNKPIESMPFLDRISRNSRDQILQFLTDVIVDEEFLVQRLMSLDQQQLEHVQNGMRPVHQDKSVFGHSTPSSLRRMSSPGPGRPEAKQAPLVLDLCRRDPFALLFDLVGLYPSAGPSSLRRRQERIWAAVCASMLSETKPGREKFIISVLDGMAYEIQPSGKRALETWIQETLRDGHFLLARSDTPSFGARTQSSPFEMPQENTDPETFYLEAVKKLFACLKNNQETKIIPQRVLNMCRIIVDKLRDSDTKFRTAPFFFLAHWLFSTFLLDEIITPESRGLMLEEYFPETARHRILRETILRAQRIVIDVSYSWNHNGAVDPSFKADVEAIAAIFRPNPGEQNEDQFDDELDKAPSGDYFLRCICPSDIHTLVNALYPERRPASIFPTFLSITTSPSQNSSASSVSGLSIFRQTPFEGDERPHIPGTSSNLSTESDHRPMTPASPSRRPTPGKAATRDRSASFEKAVALRFACTEIQSISKADLTRAAPNPAQESWSLLEIREDKVRNLDRVHALNTDHNEIDAPAEDDVVNGFRKDPDANITYLHIRKSLLKLMADPTLLGMQPSPVEVESSAVLSPFPRLQMPHNPFSPQLESPDKLHTNPFRRRSSMSSPIAKSVFDLPLRNSDRYGGITARWPESLSGAFEKAIRHLQLVEDFNKAFEFSQTLAKINALSTSNPEAESAMLRYFTTDVEHSISRSRNASAKLEILVSQLEQQCLETDLWIRAISSIANETRVKMWYCTDVRSAASYADLEKLASAIRSMSTPSQPALKRAEPPTLRHKGTLKPKNLNAVKRGEASVLDIMVTDPSYHVLCKMKDDQVALTQLWMEKSGIENICAGEERIHRLLCEMAKCLSQLISADPMTSPVLWGSELFQRDRWDGENEALQIEMTNNDGRDHSSLFSRPSSNGSEFVQLDYHARFRRQSDFNIASASLHSHDSGPDFLDSRSPTLMTRSSTTFWSPSGFRSQSPLSNISPPSRTWSPMYLRQSISRESFQSTPKVKGLLNDLRLSITGLLASDLMRAIFPTGSETDSAFFHGIGSKFADHLDDSLSHRRSKADLDFGYGKRMEREAKRDSKLARQPSATLRTESRDSLRRSVTDKRKDSPPTINTTPLLFDLDQAKRRLVRRFDLSGGPYEKLKVLHDLETLLLSSSSQEQHSSSHGVVLEGNQTPRGLVARPKTEVDILRTRLETSLLVGRSSSHLHASVRVFETLFREPSTRPACLFRDLQAIASLIPAETLDDTPHGKTFWSATIAALSLKQEMTQCLVEAADQIISQHTDSSTVKPAAAPAPSIPITTMPQPTVSSITPSADSDNHPLMQAFKLLHLAAAQSHSVAQRELATLYLTHPELLPRVLAPFSKCRDAFRASQAAKWARENSDGRKYDAETMCVAFHWMELSAAGGDRLAKEFAAGRS
ncbi:hypothetical protein K461DRAFT_140703 [Myriangium duriaei CBS 260.36]|uniref:Uncharacterized protein n=1 Tax=Myriangium duriaei CBS 260.36 TaxID=1168546 RepID=A0A9P4J3K9_9PEZI|nr:hypothetical protein K461DRAFT_140703 [Myriangium duriaei CBS 260.36]